MLVGIFTARRGRNSCNESVKRRCTSYSLCLHVHIMFLVTSNKTINVSDLMVKCQSAMATPVRYDDVTI